MEQETVAIGVSEPEIASQQINNAVDPAQKLRQKPILELREYNRLAAQKSRDKKAAKKAIESLKYDSKIEAKKDEALELLSQRIQNEHVRNVCFDLGVEAAKQLGLVANKFYWAHGLTQTLVSAKEKTSKFLELEHTAIIPSEVIHKGDCYGIWDYVISWREPDVSFSDFIEMRKIVKSDWFELGKFLEIPFEEKPHRAWANFLPQFIPDLRPVYSLLEMRNWLARQKSPTYPVTTRDFLLQASRNTMKSTASLCLGVCAVLCCPSIRILLVSETTKLSKDFIKTFRGLWERGSNPAYERFQNFFADYCIEPGDGKANEFTSPMRSFVLPQETAEAASLEVAVAGRRADLQLYDDVISNLNTGNDDQRQKGLNTYDALLKLREAGAGITITIGTPWVAPPPGGVGDLYYELMKRNDPQAVERHGEKYMSPTDRELAVMVEPAWILKPEATHLFPDHVNSLTEGHVQELTCPSRWPFKALMKEARANIQMFQTQNLCMYVESEESKWTPTFTEEELRTKLRSIDFFDKSPAAMVVASVDAANSVSQYADKSSICIAKIIPYRDAGRERNIAFVVEVIAGRWKYSDMAAKLAEACQKHQVTNVAVEKNNIPWEDWLAAVHRNFVLRGYPVPNILPRLSTGIAGSSVSAKMRRVKGTEVLFNNNQIFFAYGDWNDALFREMVRFKGQRSGSSDGSKDDMVDSLGTLTSTFLVQDTGIKPEKSEEQMQMEAAVEAQKMLRAQHDAIFGNFVSPQQQRVYTPPDESPPGGLVGTLSRFGLTKRAA